MIHKPKFRWSLLAFLLIGPWAWADYTPIDVTVFGLYGTPVAPVWLASSYTDGTGLDIVADWNPSNLISLGLSYERMTFYGSPNFSFTMYNLEGKLFPFQNGAQSFSPYIFGGAGLDPSSGGSAQLKAGLGTRVAFMGPLFLDFTAGSHWIQPPANFQYVDFRAGLSFSFDYHNPNPESNSSSTSHSSSSSSTTTTTTSTSTNVVQTKSVAAAVAAPTPVPQVVSNPVIPIGTPTAAPTEAALTLEEPTPTIVISAAPVTSVAEAKMWYQVGNEAFMAGNYPLALKAYRKSLTLKEKHKALYFYAETYSQLGVIYQFHAHKVTNHLQKALAYYKKALAIDPRTKAARKYYRPLKRQLALAAKHSKKARHKLKPKPTPADSSAPAGGTSDSTAPSNAPSSSSTPANYF